MGAPQVIIAEKDLSTRVRSFPGVYGAIVIPAKKGSEDPYLVTDDSVLLRKYTPNGRVEVGYSTAYFSALAYLQRSNKLWVVRAISGSAKYGGALVVSTESADDNSPWTTGVSDPSELTFSDTTELFHLYGANRGEWNNEISFEIITSSDVVKEPDAFMIKVYYGSSNTPVEEWTVSLKEGKKDGYGNSIYIEDVLEGSEYIRAFVNPNLSGDETPKATTSPVSFDKGDDGSAITDSEMITALDKLNNESYPVVLILDGGWATAAFHTEIITICESRKDCFGILSTPYNAEASSDYLNEIVNYKTVTLNNTSSYAALFTPHVKIYDKFNDRYLYISPDGFVGGVISYTAANYAMWYPPMGYNNRAKLNVLDVRRRFSKGEMDLLYDKNLNPIRFAEGKGIHVWGQKTLQTRPSHLDRINARLLLIVIQPAIAEILESYIGALHTPATRELIKAKIDLYMQTIKAKNGVYDYYIVCDESNNLPSDIDNHILNVDLYIKLVMSVEFIRFRTILTPTGVSFQLAEAAA